jgi:hypothetical protein
MKRLLLAYLRQMRRGPEPFVSDRYLAAHLDRPALIRTAATLVALICVLVLVFFLHEIVALILIFAVPIVAVPAFAYAASPLGYAIDNKAVYIERKALRTVRVPLSQITAVQYLPARSLQGSIRVYGTGGLFGWAGRYHVPGLGAVSMHATNLEQLIVIQRRHRKPMVISPADSAAFLTGLRRQFKTLDA